MDHWFFLFLGVSVVVIITPGQDTALTIRNSMVGGRIGGFATALGVSFGQLLWALAASIGLVAILASMESLFLTIKFFGAAYLIFLGVQSLIAAINPNTGQYQSVTEASSSRLSARSAFTHGVVSNLGNPKMAVFFASLLPQFVPDGAPVFYTMVILGLLFCFMTFFWLGFYSILISNTGQTLRKPRVQKLLNSIAGVTLIGLGLRIAFSEK